MSTALTPIAVDFRKVSSALGSGDGSLLEQLLVKYRDELKEVDELAEELEEDEDDSDDEEEESRLANLRALSQALGQAKQGLEGGQSVGDVLEGLGRVQGVSAQHQKALQDVFDDSDDEDEAEDDESSDEEFAAAADILRHLITGEKPVVTL